MKKILVVSALFCAAQSYAASEWSGRLDMTSGPSIGAWQSLSSTDQAIGISKRLAHLDRSGQEIARIGVFGGVAKSMFNQPGSSAKPLGGLTFSIPGSLLDWALGTKWGDTWVPNLKTGLLGAYDLTRIKTLHSRPNFIGIGAAWPFGK